ncbi:hypothetical protein VII00023_05947 [Vibrio ichthyoenteri ATCC 700023]|uniref:Uncharacterized protein n=1 Tax=Vibrio ichthyoenteri ATCC 700023 TaxID=870968 RepID=F9S2S5_9VIBR|nr:hypothetical protein VII00023_05947 [Vibrio ichthyoenteri ATCC 700023]
MNHVNSLILIGKLDLIANNYHLDLKFMRPSRLMLLLGVIAGSFSAVIAFILILIASWSALNWLLLH